MVSSLWAHRLILQALRPGQAPTENLLLSYFLFMALGLLVFDFLLWLHVLLFLDLQGPCWVDPADPEGFRPKPQTEQATTKNLQGDIFC